MRVYCRFLQKSVVDPEKLIEACGDSAYFLLDGRNTLRTWIVDARNRLEKMNRPEWNHHYIGFIIYKGDFRSSFPVYNSTIPGGSHGLCTKNNR